MVQPPGVGKSRHRTVSTGECECECELYLTSIYKASLGACRRAMPMACRALPRMPILVYMIVVLYWLLRLLIANTIVVQ
jgi:hypothetical protein